MAGSGITAFLITVLGQLWGTPIAVASMALTGYMVGTTSGTLVGGWWSDKKGGNLLGFVTQCHLYRRRVRQSDAPGRKRPSVDCRNRRFDA